MKLNNSKEFIDEVRNQLGNEFLQIKFKIDGELFKKNVLEELVDYDPEDIGSMQRAYAKQPAQSAKYGIALAKAKRMLATAEREEKKWRRSKRRQVTLTLSEKWRAKKIRKSPAREDVDSEIDSKYESEVDEYQANIAKWQENVDIMSVVHGSWQQRKDMLVNQGHLLNRLIDNDALQVPNSRKRG